MEIWCWMTVISAEMPLIIFVTAYDQYAIQAFEAHAIDYVLKPIDRERVRGAINRALEWHSNRHAGDEVKRLVLGAVEQVLTSGELPQMVMAAKDSNPTESVVGDRAPQIEVRQRGVTLKIRHSDIEWVDAAGDNMCIHAGGKTYVKRGTLRELLTHLDPARFKRVHRSTIVNLDSVHQVIPRDKGAFYLLLKSGERVKVSRSHNDVVREFLEP